MSVLTDVFSAFKAIPSVLGNLVSALNPISSIFSDIRISIQGLTVAVSALETTIKNQQKQAFQDALAKYQQDTINAKTADDYKSAAMDLHNVLTKL